MAKSKVPAATPALSIVARREGFRRAGVAHPAQPVLHAPGAFTEEQVEQLLAEPGLVARELTDAEYAALAKQPDAAESAAA